MSCFHDAGEVDGTQELVGYVEPVRRAHRNEANTSETAGLGAGMMEALFAVTPSETIKCVFGSSNAFGANVAPQDQAD